MTAKGPQLLSHLHLAPFLPTRHDEAQGAAPFLWKVWLVEPRRRRGLIRFESGSRRISPQKKHTHRWLSYHQSSLLQDKHAQFPKSFLIGLVFRLLIIFTALCKHSQLVSILLEQWCPELHRVFQVLTRPDPA